MIGALMLFRWALAEGNFVSSVVFCCWDLTFRISLTAYFILCRLFCAVLRYCVHLVIMSLHVCLSQHSTIVY